MKEQQPQQPQRISVLLTVVLLLLVGLPLTYFITAGPALGYVQYSRWHVGSSAAKTAAAWLEDIYQPAELLVEYTPLDSSFKSYVNWWRELLEPKPAPSAPPIFHL